MSEPEPAPGRVCPVHCLAARRDTAGKYWACAHCDYTRRFLPLYDWERAR